MDVAWQFYKQLDGFSNVPFAQFKKQLTAHQSQVRVRKERLGDEEKAFKEFRKLNPRKTHNNKGEPVFDTMPGKMLLCQDIKEGKQLSMAMDSFYISQDEYKCLQQHKFKERVYQETRRQKYINFLQTRTPTSEKKQKKDRRRDMTFMAEEE